MLLTLVKIESEMRLTLYRIAVPLSRNNTTGAQLWQEHLFRIKIQIEIQSLMQRDSSFHVKRNIS
jgi:hypothetical protein